jgi:hypothetical protein
MLQMDALSLRLFSEVDQHGTLTSSAAELQSVMMQHFTSVFALPPVGDTPLPYDLRAMLFEKPNMQAAWYDTLMLDVSEQELLQTISDAPRVFARGQDGVSIGVWKIALESCPRVRALTAALFSSCLRTSSFPSAWKSSIIVPLIKDTLKQRSMSNIRPISLQSCLGKLFNRILASWLAAIIAQYPILNIAQRGFITGGTTIKCSMHWMSAARRSVSCICCYTTSSRRTTRCGSTF